MVALLVLALDLLGLERRFGNSDEVIYAEFIRAMQRSGDYFTLRFQGHEVLQRPVVPVALYAFAAQLVEGEVGMRLAPALFTALAALTVMATVWRCTGKVWAGAAAALFASAIPSVHLYGRLLFSDPPYVLACVCGLAATLAAVARPRLFPWVGAALGAAVGTKSFAVVAPALGLAPGVLWLLRRHGGRELRLGWALLLFLALAMPFYAIGLAQHGQRFIDEHFGYNLWARARGLDGIGLPGVGAYFRHIWGADGPVVFLLLFGSIGGAAVAAVVRRDPRLGMASASAVITLLVLSLVGTRLPHYLLVFYPQVAVCAGLLLARFVSSLPSVSAAALAAMLCYETVQAGSFDANADPSPESVELGRAAAAATLAEEPVYSLDWYAPALGWYADRTWKLLGTTEGWVRIVGSVDLFKAAGTVSSVPPWPAGRFLVAGEPWRLERALAGRAVRSIATSGAYALWEVH